MTIENCMMLKTMQMFFLNSWMQKKNGIFQVEEVSTIETLTIGDIRCLWHSIKQVKRKDKIIYIKNLKLYLHLNQTFITNYD
jgi:hypothetical protein